MSRNAELIKVARGWLDQPPAAFEVECRWLVPALCDALEECEKNMPKVRVSYRLEEDADKRLRKLAESWGVSQAQVIEILVREAEGKELKTVKK